MGRITRKDIPQYSHSRADSGFRGLVDRTWLGANSNISFEELSASGGAKSIASSQPPPMASQVNAASTTAPKLPTTGMTHNQGSSMNH